MSQLPSCASSIFFYQADLPAGADYGLGNIGTCLGPPPPRGPPPHKNKSIMIIKKNGKNCHEWGPKDAGNNDHSCIQFAMKN